MNRTISMEQLRRGLGETVERVFYKGDRIVIERNGKPMAAIVPLRDYEAQEQLEKRFWETVEKMQEATKDIPAEEIEAMVDEAVQEVRAERRAKSVAQLDRT